MKRPIAATFLATCLFSLPLIGRAEIRMPQSLFGNGGGVMNAGTQFVYGTLGQLAGGMQTNSSVVCQNGFWFSPVLFCSHLDEPGPKPASRFRLGPGGPNPFRELATLRYTVPRQGRIGLKIYDVSGRLVKVLVGEREHPPGEYVVQLAGVSLPTGIYFCRMTAPEPVPPVRLVRVQ